MVKKKLLIWLFSVSCVLGAFAMDVSQRDPDLDSAEFRLHCNLNWAASAGNVAEVKRLIAAGAKPQLARNGPNVSMALMDAIHYGHVEICQLLVNAGADLATSKKGMSSGLNYGYQDTPLILAARRGHTEICELFVDHQERITKERETVLLCLNRLKKINNQFGILFYNQRKTLLFPYMGKYVPFADWLKREDHLGKMAYDYLPMNCLKPDQTAIEKFLFSPIVRGITTATGTGGTLVFVHYAVKKSPTIAITGLFTIFGTVYFFLKANSKK
jgi:ankyrin repeat protein